MEFREGFFFCAEHILGSFFGGFTEDKNDRVERVENELSSADCSLKGSITSD